MRKRWIVLALVALFIAYCGWGYARSLKLESTWIQVSIPSNDGHAGFVRVAQVSDLHRAVYGEDNAELVALVASKSPNLIVATGDMIDVKTEGIADCLALFERLRAIAPVAFSLGNHEIERADVRELTDALEALDVRVVHDSAAVFYVGNQRLTVGGVYYEQMIPRLLDAEPSLDILLCHFPQYVDAYAESGIPLTFSGHTHGGQFRIPLFDIPLYAPNQGFFPKYTAGLYDMNGDYLIVSRGLGNSSFPFRIHNPPEVVIVDIAYQ